MKRKPAEPDKPFYIQRKRLGVVKFVRPEGDFGFIEAEDFREDVFFHKSAWQGNANGRTLDPAAGLYVEYELDEEYFAREKKLRAKVVRLTDRPMGRKLSMRQTPHLINAHHPKALRKRPTWRGGAKKETPRDSETERPE